MLNRIIVERDDPVEEAMIAAEIAIKILSGTGGQQPPVSAVKPNVASGGSLARMIRDCVNEKKRTKEWTPKTVAENESIFQHIKEILKNPTAETITLKHSTAFKDTLLRLPPNRTKGRYAGKSTKEILAMRPAQTMAVSSVNKYLRRVSSLFEWGKKHGHVHENPLEWLGIKEKRRPHEQRARYTYDEVRLLFDVEHLSPKKLRKRYQYWLPLLGLYTGARLEELCQLHLEDVRRENGIWVLDINDRQEKRLKTPAAERLVPIHSALANAGFLDYVEDLGKEGKKRVFPELQQRRDGYSQTASKWFGRYRKKIALGKDFHSLRHTFVDELLQLGADDKKVATLVGHAEESMTSGRYRNPFRPEVLLPVVSMLDFDSERLREGTRVEKIVGSNIHGLDSQDDVDACDEELKVFKLNALSPLD